MQARCKGLLKSHKITPRPKLTSVGVARELQIKTCFFSLRRAAWLVVPGETVLIREGDPGDRYYLLASGTVRVEQAGRFLRSIQRPGDGFGEIALLRNVPRTATITSTSELAVLAIDRASFLDAVTGHPGAAAAADHEVAGRLL